MVIGNGYIVLLALLLTGLASAACGSSEPIALEGQEIREYRGEDLSSIQAFRENSIAGPQDVSLDEYRLEITGLVDQPLALTYDQVLDRQHYAKVVTLDCVEGWSVKILWEGVLLEDLLSQAGVEDGAVVAIFHAVDGYSSSLPLDYTRQNKIILAHKINGVTLPPERGFPFQVVAESKWGYKWVKWVSKIELSDDPDYRGYWESRGYSKDGDVSGPMFER
ncbi:MAG TPA: molybdopterin-dependent oxidoreductase [Anaerolineae bacterium]|nr:molybdopterin-dependent oxidoreductase [Anaerolineae bacterium]